METVHIDGSYGEGGGQVIRTSLSLAVITGKTVEIANVRAGRSKPGLQPQHLTAVYAAAALCDAVVEGAVKDSGRILFTPQSRPRPGDYRFEIGTAGATTLVMQTVLLPLTLAAGNSRVTVIGGTHVPFAPVAEYIRDVYLRTLQQAGLSVCWDCARAGYNPRGGGEISVEVGANNTLQPLDLSQRGKLRTLTAYIITSELPDHVSERGAAAVEKGLKGIGRRVNIVRQELPSNGPGAAVFIVAECEGGVGGFSSLGARGKPMEQVAEEACKDYLRWWKSGAACDEHLADQLVLPMALAEGKSRWTTPAVTEHLRTVLWVTQQFLPIEVTLEEQADGSEIVTMHGVGTTWDG